MISVFLTELSVTAIMIIPMFQSYRVIKKFRAFQYGRLLNVLSYPQIRSMLHMSTFSITDNEIT